jgi:hypothetical protein
MNRATRKYELSSLAATLYFIGFFFSFLLPFFKSIIITVVFGRRHTYTEHEFSVLSSIHLNESHGNDSHVVQMLARIYSQSKFDMSLRMFSYFRAVDYKQDMKIYQHIIDIDHVSCLLNSSSSDIIRNITINIIVLMFGLCS